MDHHIPCSMNKYKHTQSLYLCVQKKLICLFNTFLIWESTTITPQIIEITTSVKFPTSIMVTKAIHNLYLLLRWEGEKNSLYIVFIVLVYHLMYYVEKKEVFLFVKNDLQEDITNGRI